MERWYISGSHGFLGSKLLGRLERSSQEVIRGDRDGNLPTGVDYVVNCQTYGNMYWHKDAEQIYKANLFNLVRMLGSADGVRAFIHISSSSVLLSEQTYYSLAKRASEELCVLDGRPVVVRPSSTTGVGEQKEHLIPKLIDSCLNGTEMPFVSESTHDYINISDVISAIALLAQMPDTKGRIFNVSSGTATSNEEVLAIVEGYVGSRANLKRVGTLRKYDTKDWKVDNSDMRALGWSPQVSLRETIQQMIAQYYPGV